MLSPVRRVVTGRDAAGRSVVQFDSLVSPPPELPTDVSLWVTDSAPASNAGRADAAARPVKLEPPPQGSVFRFVVFPPAAALAGMSAQEIERGSTPALFAAVLIDADPV